MLPHRECGAHRNLVAVDASIFAFFLEELFGQIGPVISGIGFCLPIFAFLVGCWLTRTNIRAVIGKLGRPGRGADNGYGLHLGRPPGSATSGYKNVLEVGI
jgi:hypothetical protein